MAQSAWKRDQTPWFGLLGRVMVCAVLSPSLSPSWSRFGLRFEPKSREGLCHHQPLLPWGHIHTKGPPLSRASPFLMCQNSSPGARLCSPCEQKGSSGSFQGLFPAQLSVPAMKRLRTGVEKLLNKSWLCILRAAPHAWLTGTEGDLIVSP